MELRGSGPGPGDLSQKSEPTPIIASPTKKTLIENFPFFKNRNWKDFPRLCLIAL